MSWLKHCRNPGSKKKAAAGGSKESAVNLDDSDDDDSVAVTGTRRRSDEDDNNNNNESTTHPHLVVAPASVLSNWKLEFEKFAPDLVVVKYHGSMAERTDIQHHLRQFQPGKKKRAGAEIDVVLAPITYFQKEKSDDRNFLRRFSWDYLVVDEGSWSRIRERVRQYCFPGCSLACSTTNPALCFLLDRPRSQKCSRAAFQVVGLLFDSASTAADRNARSEFPERVIVPAELLDATVFEQELRFIR